MTSTILLGNEVLNRKPVFVSQISKKASVHVWHAPDFSPIMYPVLCSLNRTRKYPLELNETASTSAYIVSLKLLLRRIESSSNSSYTADILSGKY